LVGMILVPVGVVKNTKNAVAQRNSSIVERPSLANLTPKNF
jgi:hypothetical protein